MDKFQARNFNPQMIHILNNCRIYLRIINIANLANIQRTRVKIWALKGNRGCSSFLQWPQSATPTTRD